MSQPIQDDLFSKLRLPALTLAFAVLSLPTLSSPLSRLDRSFSPDLSIPLLALPGRTDEGCGSPLAVTTIAGSISGTGGFLDGKQNEARFFSPAGAAADSTGNIYVADTSNNAIRKITSKGQVTTIAGAYTGSSGGSSGFQDGKGNAARFYGPTGLAFDSSGNIYVADTRNNAIRKITSTGQVTTIAGAYTGLTGGSPGFQDGTGEAARFDGPLGLALDSSGNIYVADTGNNAIRKVTSNGEVTTIAGAYTGSIGGSSGFRDGTGNAARFYAPAALAVDSSGNIIVADNGNNAIRQITVGGTVTTIVGAYTGSTGGIRGFLDATGNAARFSMPMGLTVDSSGNIYLADYGNDAIRKITSRGTVITIAGAYTGSSGGSGGFLDGTGNSARLYGPYSLAADFSGNLFVADTGNNAIRKICL